MLRQLEQRLDALKESKPRPERFGIANNDTETIERGHHSVVRTLSALHLLGTYRQIPDDAKREPRVHERFARAAGDVQEVVTDARDSLVEMDDGLRARIDARLRREPDLPMRVMETIDELANSANVPLAQRTFLRTTTAQLSWRLKNQGTRAVIGDVIAKWDRALIAQASEGPVRARFRTSAGVSDIRRAVCALEPRTEIDGEPRAIDLEWDGEACARPLSGAIRGTVRADDEGSERVVTLEIHPPPRTSPEAVQELRQVVVDVGRELRERTIGFANVSARAAEERERTKACKRNDDCDSGDCKRLLFDNFGKCVPQRPGSERVLETTGRVAVVGIATLAVCVGAVILVVALFMLVVAGFMALGGN
jgi:hypothetical protein